MDKKLNDQVNENKGPSISKWQTILKDDKDKKDMKVFDNEKQDSAYDRKLFSTTFWEMGFKPFMKETGKFYLEGGSCALNNCANIVVILVNFIYIGMLKDPVIQASYGLGVSFFSCFFLCQNLAVFETTGIYCAKEWGAGKKKRACARLYQGFIFLSILLFFSILSFAFSEQILLAISIAPVNAKLTSTMLKWLIPGCIMQGINFQIQAFCMAQGVMKIFGISNIISLILCSFLTPWLVLD